KQFKNYPSGTNDLTTGRVCGIAATPDGNLWFLTRGGLSFFDGQKFHRIPEVPAITAPLSDIPWPKSLVVDQQGRLWAAAGGEGLWRIQGTNLTHISQNDGLLSRFQDALHVGPDSMLWFRDYTEDYTIGVSRYDGRRFEAVKTEDFGDDAGVTSIQTTPD